jgi:hypothetical protein
MSVKEQQESLAGTKQFPPNVFTCDNCGASPVSPYSIGDNWDLCKSCLDRVLIVVRQALPGLCDRLR